MKQTAVRPPHRRGWPLAACLIVLALLLADPRQAWSAEGCNIETNIFVQKKGPDQSGAIAYGTGNSIYVRNRDINPNCGSVYQAEAHSTAHMESTNNDRMAEVGWVEYLDNFGTNRWAVFAEWRVGTQVSGGFDNGFLIPQAFWGRFWVNPIGSSDHWNFWFNDGVNGNQLVDGDVPMSNFRSGLAFGETARRGGVPTGASDEQRELDFLYCGNPCHWSDWGDNLDPFGSNSGYDTICNWDWNRLARDHYETVKVTPNSC